MWNYYFPVCESEHWQHHYMPCSSKAEKSHAFCAFIAQSTAVCLACCCSRCSVNASQIIELPVLHVILVLGIVSLPILLEDERNRGNFLWCRTADCKHLLVKLSPDKLVIIFI